MRERPPANTATVRPPAASAAAWAIPSIPRANPCGAAQQIPAHVRSRLILAFTDADCRVSAWADRRQRIMDALAAEPGVSDRGLGRRLGIDHHAVATVRRSLERAGDIPRQRRR